MARPSITVPATQDGRRSRFQICPPVRPVPPAVVSRSTFCTPVLILRAERHEDRAEQRERNADEDAGVLEDADELVGHVSEVVEGHAPLDTNRLCSIGSGRGCSSDSHHGRSRPALPADPVSEITDEIRTLVADMFETMDAAPGVGLAAPR
jgi:hypothetical protein